MLLLLSWGGMVTPGKRVICGPVCQPCEDRMSKGDSMSGILVFEVVFAYEDEQCVSRATSMNESTLRLLSF